MEIGPLTKLAVLFGGLGLSFFALPENRKTALASSTIIPYISSGAVYLYHTVAVITILGLLTWLLPTLSLILRRPQDLKKKYKAEWALVTGASSGIGRAITEKLARQGISVVLVALDDPLLTTAHKELTEAYPAVKFRKIGADLGKSDGSYLQPIIKGTEDIHISLLFNNAGYMVTGFFRKMDPAKLAANVECNATAGVRITRHFVPLMVEKRCGAVCFTSSASAYIPSPFATTYAATKAFISAFAASLAIEVQYYGVDVCAVHPSPVRSRFLDKATKLESLDFAMKFSSTPEGLPDLIFATLGRAVWRDLGGFAIVARGILKLLDYGFLSGVFASNAHRMGDWQTQTAGEK